MKDLHTAPDEHLEARITAWILGEASPFEAAELEALCAADPQLQLYANRIKALHSLLIDSQHPTSDPFWKLSPEKREKLDPIIGPNNSSQPNRDSYIRRTAYRTAFGIAAVLTVTVFIKRFVIFSSHTTKEAPVLLSYEYSSHAEPNALLMDETADAFSAQEETMLAEKKSIRSESSAPRKPSAPPAAKLANRQIENTLADADVQSVKPNDRLRSIESAIPSELPAGMAAAKSESSQSNSPQSAMTKAIAAAEGDRGVKIPVPEIALNTPSANFGDGKDFGGGWGGGQNSVTDSKNDGRVGNMRYDTEGGGNRDFSDIAIAGEAFAAKDDAFASNEPQNKGGFKYQPGQTNNEGQRSGNEAIERKSIDGLLAQTDRSVAADEKQQPGPGNQAPVEDISSNHKGLAQREIARRQKNITEADSNLMEGREAYAKGDYTKATEKYKEALGAVRDVPALADRQESYSQHLADASVAQAQQMRKVGKYDEARKLLEQAETLSPADATIKNELGYLNDPLRTNPALTYEHQGKVDEVRRNLYMVQGNYDLGKYDDAKKSYEDTLRIDPYNEAARRGLEKVENTKSDYYRAAYSNTRAELLMEVDKAWELAVPADETSLEAKAKNLKPAKEGETASNEAIRELIYPTEYESNQAGQLADKGKGNDESGYAWFSRGENQKAGAAAPSPAVDPFTDPKSESINQMADIREGGLKRDLANLTEGKNEITLEKKPQIAELEGFINYGSPIISEPKQIDITTKHVEITQANDKDLFKSWLSSKTDAQDELDIYSQPDPAKPIEFQSLATGYTGEVPLLGDIPMTGRLFQEQEIHAGYKSEYLFRGLEVEKQKKPSLTDLSEEISTSEEPFSTFSLNISDASFQLALAAMEKGERPDPESIKPEQFYNAVDYGDPAPSASEPVAAAIDQTAHPVIPGRNLVRVSVRTASAGRSAAQPLRLTLLVDQSGSMVRADRRAAMDTALAQLATLLTENDKITVIGFSRTPHLLADSLPGNEAAKISELINQTASEGGTNLEQAINLASDMALRNHLGGAQNRIVLFTDGAANLGDADPDRLSNKITTLRQQGLAFDIAGIGTNDLNDRLLSDLARHGNGRYYLVGEKTANNLAAQLAGAFRPAAENVKIQVKLNPQRVGNYKLIGFEKDRLKTEDFRNDAVDAAELAADEAGVALYQVETLPEGTGEIGEVSVRFHDTASGEMVERTWTIPYDASAPAFDKANPKTQLATLALLAAQKLQPGPLADAINFSNYSETIAKLKQANAKSAKTQQLLNLISQLK